MLTPPPGHWKERTLTMYTYTYAGNTYQGPCGARPTGDDHYCFIPLAFLPEGGSAEPFVLDNGEPVRCTYWGLLAFSDGVSAMVHNHFTGYLYDAVGADRYAVEMDWGPRDLRPTQMVYYPVVQFDGKSGYFYQNNLFGGQQTIYYKERRYAEEFLLAVRLCAENGMGAVLAGEGKSSP